MSVSAWTTIGTNTGNPAALGLNVPIVAGTDGQVRHECLMWVDGTAAINTKNFDFIVNGDFTVVLNGTGQPLDSDAGNVDVVIQGSVDGSNFVDMRDLGTWDSGTADIGHLIYDYVTYGRMPYMRLNIDSGNNVDNSAKPFKVCIFMNY